MRVFLIISLLLANLQLNANKTLVIGALPFNTPFTTQANMEGLFYGFDISLVNNVCMRLNVTCIFKRQNLTQLFNSVSNGKVDLAIGGITITKQREAQYLFSTPYLTSYASFLVLTKSGFNDINDLYNKKIGAQICKDCYKISLVLILR